MLTIILNIRRFDILDDPSVVKATLQCEPSITYKDLKDKVMNACNLSASINKIIKLRNSEQMMIPYSMMLDNVADNYFVDVTNMNKARDTGMNLLQDAHMNSVYSKLNNMVDRIQQAENLLPQLECKRRAHLEETVSHLSNKVLFLNRRFDDILPKQLRSKMPYAIA